MYVTMIGKDGVRISVHNTKVEQFAKNGYEPWVVPHPQNGTLVQVETIKPQIFQADYPGPDLPGNQFSEDRKQELNKMIKTATDAARPDGLKYEQEQEPEAEEKE